MPECNHDCASCAENCPSRDPSSFLAHSHPLSSVKKMIAVVSGKGGVGKSLTTSLLAVNAIRDGKKAAIIDADVTGPSIPKIFGLKDYVKGSEDGMYPVKSQSGIEVMSLNLVVDDPSEPVAWRGPVLSGAVKQFWTDTIYGDVDELYVDMPPGTGDVPLTVFQSLPIDGIVIVTSPSDLVSLIVEKAIKLAESMNVKVLGIVNNMAYLDCPCCGQRIYPFGKLEHSLLAEKHHIEVFDELPIDPSLGKLCDEGEIEQYKGRLLDKISQAIHSLPDKLKK